jgi:hypothetical protein
LTFEQALDFYKPYNDQGLFELLPFYTSGPIFVYEIQKLKLAEEILAILGKEEREHDNGNQKR